MLKLLRIDWYRYHSIWSYGDMFYDILRFLLNPLALRPHSRTLNKPSKNNVHAIKTIITDSCHFLFCSYSLFCLVRVHVLSRLTISMRFSQSKNRKLRCLIRLTVLIKQLFQDSKLQTIFWILGLVPLNSYRIPVQKLVKNVEFAWI